MLHSVTDQLNSCATLALQGVDMRLRSLTIALQEDDILYPGGDMPLQRVVIALQGDATLCRVSDMGLLVRATSVDSRHHDLGQ